jgi:hypothetical protein
MGTQTTDTTEGFTGDNAVTTFTLGNNPAVKVTYVTVDGATQTAVTDYKIDYYAGKVHFTTAPGTDLAIVVSYRYSTRTSVQNAATAASLGYADIVGARNKIRVQKYFPDAMLVYPDEEDDISQMTSPITWVDASQYGSPESRLTGEAGKIAGMSVLSTVQMFPGVAVYLQRVRCGWLVMKRNLQVKRKEIPEKDGFGLYFYMEFAPKVTRDLAVAISVNHALDSEKL